MRIVVSGTHASGKSTLIGDFMDRHPDWQMLPDPFEYLEDAPDEPDAGTFFRQLRFAAARLHETAGGHLIAERGPLDFLAYLDALEALGRPTRSHELFRRGIPLTADASSRVDVIVLLPLAETEVAGLDDEDPELRVAMDAALWELADDPDLVGDARVVEISGDRSARLERLEAVAAGHLTEAAAAPMAQDFLQTPDAASSAPACASSASAASLEVSATPATRSVNTRTCRPCSMASRADARTQ